MLNQGWVELSSWGFIEMKTALKIVRCITTDNASIKPMSDKFCPSHLVGNAHFQLARRVPPAAMALALLIDASD